MGKLTPGYWPNNYWAANYWPDDYWADYGYVAAIIVQTLLLDLVSREMELRLAQHLGELLLPQHESRVLELLLNEGVGDTAEDSSGEGNDGTIYGASWVDGKYGKALSFDGIDDFVQSKLSVDLDLTSHGITLSAWVKASYKAPDPSWASWQIVGRWAQLALGIKGSDINLQIGAYLNGNTAWYNAGDKWEEYIHIVIVYQENSTSRITYLNGESIGTQSSGAVGDYSGNILIGKNNYVDVPYGIIDDVRIYDRALSADEVKQLWLRGVGVPRILTLGNKEVEFA